ncbi:MAG: DMT family transporter [Arenicella sp.]|nr:DMT family transporter [Arenicella sp.]
MILIGGALLSLLGIGVRLMDGASSLQIVFYRAVSQAAFLALLVYMQNRKPATQIMREVGYFGVLAAALIAAAGLFMILAVMNTTVANAVFITSLAPLSSALLGKVFLNENVHRRTWGAIAIAVTGIAIIFGSGLSGGGLLGMAFAFLMMLFYSGSLVAIRSQSGADMIAVCAMSGALLAIGVAPFVGSFEISTHDLLICMGLGTIQVGLGLVLITKGTQHVPTVQVSLLALLEVVLSPLWVWVGVGEVPSIYSLVGGSIVLVGVVLQALDQRGTQVS